MPDNQTAITRYEDRYPTTEIRPGVRFPDWTAVSSDTAAEALAAIVTAFGVGDDGKPALGPEETRVRQAVLHLFARHGRAPDLRKIAEQAELGADRTQAILGQLNDRDLVVLNDHGEVTGCYPITINRTEHHVRVGSQTINAMCAIDALGVGSMYGRDVHIQSSCRNCGAGVEIDTADNGRSLKTVEPRDLCVWSGMRPSEGRAETTLCTVLAFFCSGECLETWRKENNPDTPGYRLTPDEGLGVGRAIFGQVLLPPT